MKIDIRPVAGSPEFHLEIAQWLWEEWGTPANRGVYRSLVLHAKADGVPAIYAAFLGGKPVGTVGILRTDLLSRQEFTPWMAVLFVLPQYRRRGIAGALQRHALAEAGRYGYDEIYLYTKLTGFYEKSGWGFVEDEVDDHGEAIRIYRKQL